jgi:hypothetical protein
VSGRLESVKPPSTLVSGVLVSPPPSGAAWDMPQPLIIAARADA